MKKKKGRSKDDVIRIIEAQRVTKKERSVGRKQRFGRGTEIERQRKELGTLEHADAPQKSKRDSTERARAIGRCRWMNSSAWVCGSRD